MRIRKISEEDIDFVYKVANDPHTRSMSVFTSSIEYEDHKNWFANRLQDLEVSHFIVEMIDATPVGQVIINRIGEVHVGIHPDHRGNGFSKKALLKIVDFAAKELELTLCTAHIRPENIASIRAFTSVGFTQEGEKDINGLRMLFFKYAIKL